MKRIFLLVALLAATTVQAGEREGLVQSRHIVCQSDVHGPVVAIEEPMKNVNIKGELDPTGQPLLQRAYFISKTKCTPELIESIRMAALDSFGFVDVKITDTIREVYSTLPFGGLKITTLMDLVAEISTPEGPVEFKVTKILSTRTVFEP